MVSCRLDVQRYKWTLLVGWVSLRTTFVCPPPEFSWNHWTPRCLFLMLVNMSAHSRGKHRIWVSFFNYLLSIHSLNTTTVFFYIKMSSNNSCSTVFFCSRVFPHGVDFSNQGKGYKLCSVWRWYQRIFTTSCPSPLIYSFSVSFIVVHSILHSPSFRLPVSLQHRSPPNVGIDGSGRRRKYTDDCPRIDFCHTDSRHWEAVHLR